jgi:hypothetical protein
MNTIIENKVRNLFLKINLASNLSRKKFILDILLGMIEGRKVTFNEISLHIKTDSKVASTERRIQSFFSDFIFDYTIVASFLLSLMPFGKLSLCIDRTEWDFGKFQCNILMITVRLLGVGLPLYWELLDNKSGNSNAANRIDLMQKCIDLIGVNRIGILIGDREFIGNKWLKWLKDNNIPFCMRMPKSHLVTLENGEIWQIKDLLKQTETLCLSNCIVDNIKCNVYLKKLDNDNYLYLIGSEPAKNLGTLYRNRWSIEVCFQSFKKRGFDLETTHLRDPEKLKKLLVFTSLALILCVNLGIFLHEKVKKVKVKKHGYKPNSFFRQGMNEIRKIIKGKEKQQEKYIINALDYLIRWIDMQLTKYQQVTKSIG